jgi:hypothetical protein
MKQWRNIKGFEDLYMISSDGEIVSFYKNGKLLKHSIDKQGYHLTCLYKDNKNHYFKVHRLVAAAFIPNPKNKPQVNHIDGNKSNNSISNLEWATGFENQQHSIRTGLRVMPKGEKHCNYGKRGSLVHNAKLVLNKENGIFYESAKEAAESINMKYATLKKKLSGRNPNNTNLIYA